MDMKLKPAITVLLLGLLLVIYVPHSSVAASGGVIGGDTFSSHSSSNDDSHSFSSSNDDSHSFSTLTDSVPYFRYDDANVAGSGSGGRGGGGRDGGGSLVGGVIMVLFVAFIVWVIIRSNSNRGSFITVIKLQVGLLGTAKAIQKELDKIAQVADTSTRKGLSYVLQESTLALLRHPNYCISGYSSVDAELGIEDGEKCFKQLSKEELEKVDNMEGIDDGEKNFNEQENLDREPLVSVNSIKRQTTSSKSSLSKEYIVVTILVAAEGLNKLPKVDCSGNLKVALQKLGSIPTNNIKAVQVLWTPQLENEALTERELLEDYPLLKPL
ncbi:hypothetical protein C5167_020755 [Papaver somniferum]|uniref:Uncharacterized protein n=1 Tax=Papaver somniferum TaxID=3469 RepID=A0A4Y7IUH6_PAPSO|nr:uncharacterized protein LOC113352538 [Papaver somniferum]RZC52337.1 hypothetical protein C5167_020755 [Papaver somniferum]